jgi:hypothetical protein
MIANVKVFILPVETPNGVIVDFTLPSSLEYEAGTLEVYRDGIQILITELSTTQFRTASAPTTGEELRCSFIAK